MDEGYDVAVVGATGAVGETILEVLEQRDFPVARLYPLASARSLGKVVSFRGKSLRVQELADFDFSQVRFGLFSAGGAVSARYAPLAAAAGCIVIDNTSHFRQQQDIPLLVPEVNREALAAYTGHNIVANPNCSTIQMVLALKPIHDAVGLVRVNVATYQAVSGTGKNAVRELADQTAKLLNGQPVACEVYDRQIAFNALPHIDAFQDNGYTREEMKMVWETQKILGDDEIQVNPTCVRVPVFHGHSEAVHIETRTKLNAADARELLRAAPGVEVLDDPAGLVYPTAVTDSAGQDAVFVGRIREDISHPRGLNLWVVGDNLRKGAALNAVQIAECLIEDYL